MHTPGPWEVTYKKENPVCIHGYNGNVIVEINDLYDNNDINLIAAAPELLEVLEKLMELPIAVSELGYLKRGIGILTEDAIWLKAEEVIAKAKGEFK